MAQLESDLRREGTFINSVRLPGDLANKLHQTLEMAALTGATCSVRFVDDVSAYSFGIIAVPHVPSGSDRVVFFSSRIVGDGHGGPYFSPSFLLAEVVGPGKLRSLPLSREASPINMREVLASWEQARSFTPYRSPDGAVTSEPRESSMLLPFWVSYNHLRIANAARCGDLAPCCVNSADCLW